MREHNSRETILQCALQLFAQKGYEGASPNEIVELAGVKKPTLYHFFGSKEGLFEALLREYYGQLDARLQEACVYIPHPADYYRDVYPALLGVVNVYFRFARENTAFYLMVLSMGFLPPHSKTARISEKHQSRQYAILQGLFESIARVHHNLRGKETIHAVRFLAYINAQIGFWHRGYSELDDAGAQSIVRGFLHGIFS